MIILSILQLLLSNAVTLRRDKSILYRVSITILIYSSLLAFTSLYLTSLDRGIGLYGGLFHVTSITHTFHIFVPLIFALGMTILSVFRDIGLSISEARRLVGYLSKQYVQTFSYGSFIIYYLEKKVRKSRFPHMLVLYSIIRFIVILLILLYASLKFITETFPSIAPPIGDIGAIITDLGPISAYWLLAILIGLLFDNFRQVIIVDLQFDRIDPITTQAGVIIGHSYSIWDLNDPTCLTLMALFNPNGYRLVNGAVWNRRIQNLEDRNMLLLNYSGLAPFVHAPNIAAGQGWPLSTPVWLPFPANRFNYAYFYNYSTSFFYHIEVLNNGTSLSQSYNSVNNTFNINGIVAQIN